MILTTIWTLLGSGMNDKVWALNTHNNELLAGGYFKTRAVFLSILTRTGASGCIRQGSYCR